MQVKKQQLEQDMEQWTGLKLGKECKAVYCHPAYLTQYAKCQAWYITSGNQDFWEKYKQPQIYKWYPLIAENEEELKSLLVKVKEESEKVGFKLNIQKAKIMASGPTTS